MAEEQKHFAVTLTDKNFENEVLKFNGLALVDFWAQWCGPCLLMGPRVEALAEKYAGDKRVKIGKVDVDANEETQNKYGILSLPTFAIFINGKLVGGITGACNDEELESLIVNNIAKLEPAKA